MECHQFYCCFTLILPLTRSLSPFPLASLPHHHSFHDYPSTSRLLFPSTIPCTQQLTPPLHIITSTVATTITYTITITPTIILTITLSITFIIPTVEINQGMDERNERLVFDQIVQSCCGGTVSVCVCVCVCACLCSYIFMYVCVSRFHSNRNHSYPCIPFLSSPLPLFFSSSTLIFLVSILTFLCSPLLPFLPSLHIFLSFIPFLSSFLFFLSSLPLSYPIFPSYLLPLYFYLPIFLSFPPLILFSQGEKPQYFLVSPKLLQGLRYIHYTQNHGFCAVFV